MVQTWLHAHRVYNLMGRGLGDRHWLYNINKNKISNEHRKNSNHLLLLMSLWLVMWFWWSGPGVVILPWASLMGWLGTSSSWRPQLTIKFDDGGAILLFIQLAALGLFKWQQQDPKRMRRRLQSPQRLRFRAAVVSLPPSSVGYIKRQDHPRSRGRRINSFLAGRNCKATHQMAKD